MSDRVARRATATTGRRLPRVGPTHAAASARPVTVTVVRIIIGIVLVRRRALRAVLLQPRDQPTFWPGASTCHRGDGAQPAHRFQRPGLHRPRRLLRHRRVHHRPSSMVDHGWSFEADHPGGCAAGALRRRGRRHSRRCGCGACTSPCSRSVWPCSSPGSPRSTSTAAAASPCCAPTAIEFDSLINGARQRPVAVLRVPGHRGRAVRPGLEPGPQPHRPSHDRRPRPGAGRATVGVEPRQGQGHDVRHQRGLRRRRRLTVGDDRPAPPTRTNPLLYFQLSIEFLVAVVIGGAATILGPAVGAFVLDLPPAQHREPHRRQEVLAPAVFGAALILIVYVLPEGVVGGLHRLDRPTHPAPASPPSALDGRPPVTLQIHPARRISMSSIPHRSVRRHAARRGPRRRGLQQPGRRARPVDRQRQQRQPRHGGADGDIDTSQLPDRPDAPRCSGDTIKLVSSFPQSGSDRRVRRDRRKGWKSYFEYIEREAVASTIAGKKYKIETADKDDEYNAQKTVAEHRGARRHRRQQGVRRVQRRRHREQHQHPRHPRLRTACRTCSPPPDRPAMGQPEVPVDDRLRRWPRTPLEGQGVRRAT